MRRPHHLFRLFFISIFLLISLVIVPQSHAAYTPPTGQDFLDLLTKNKTLQDYGKEFCDKRSGNLMNLETWFSGKCGKDIDTLSGDGVGFSDIIVLQGIEALIGPQQKGFIEQMVDTIQLLVTFKKFLGLNNGQTLNEKLATFKAQHPNNNGGVISQLANLTGSIILSKPAGSADYIAYISSNLQQKHIIDQTYAASPGYGFTALSPILPVWRAFRNIAYLLFAFVFILYGVMIMLRVKIDSKTAATIQLAIPKLIATLLIITFSYAIVGLLIDISTVVTALAVNILTIGDKNILNLNSWTDTILSVAGGTSGAGAFGSFLVNMIIAIFMAPFLLVGLIFGPAYFLPGLLLFATGLSGFGVVIAIIIIIAIGLSYIKLILKLLEAFFSIVVNLIFAPIILLGNVLPGSDSFGSWLRSIYGNLAVFPTAVFFLTLSYALMVQPVFGIITDIGKFTGWPVPDLTGVLGVNHLSSTGGMWAPPMTFPVVGANGDIILSIIGFGLLLMSSKYVDMVRDALKVPPFKYGSAIGDALKSGVGGQDLWAKKGYKLPAPKYTAPITNYMQASGGAKVKPAVDAVTKL